MMIEMFVLKSDKAVFYFLRCRIPRRETPLPVGSDTCSQQFFVPSSDDSLVGDMKELSGKTKHISRHQESNTAKYYSLGDG